MNPEKRMRQEAKALWDAAILVREGWPAHLALARAEAARGLRVQPAPFEPTMSRSFQKELREAVAERHLGGMNPNADHETDAAREARQTRERRRIKRLHHRGRRPQKHS
jgi:hypothetical protein